MPLFWLILAEFAILVQFATFGEIPRFAANLAELQTILKNFDNQAELLPNLQNLLKQA